MLLYHGTAGNNVEAIRSKGIIPRATSGGQWLQRASRADCVYLTTIFGAMYANAAVRHDRVAVDRLAVIEIDCAHLDSALLLPDEGFLDQCITMKDHFADLGRRKRKLAERFHKERLPILRDSLEAYAGRNWQEMLCRVSTQLWHGANRWAEMPGWEASLAGMGTCAYKGVVPAAAITRIAYATITAANPHPIFAFFNQIQVSIDHHKKFGKRMCACNRWLFGVYDPNEWRDVVNPWAYSSREGFEIWQG